MKTEKKRVRDIEALEKRRRKGMALLAKGVFQAEVARMVGVSRMTVMRWERLRTEKARGAWKRGRLGRPPKSARMPFKLVRSCSQTGCPVSRSFFKEMDRLLYVENDCEA